MEQEFLSNSSLDNNSLNFKLCTLTKLQHINNNNGCITYLLDILWVLPGDYLCGRGIRELKAK